jgi:hypothetical protein
MVMAESLLLLKSAHDLCKNVYGATQFCVLLFKIGYTRCGFVGFVVQFAHSFNGHGFKPSECQAPRSRSTRAEAHLWATELERDSTELL